MDYINGHLVAFDNDETMSIFVGSNLREFGAPKGKTQYCYLLSYSPKAGSAINGVSVKDIEWTPARKAFIAELTGGAQFAKIYPTMLANYRRELRSAPTGRYIDRGPYEL